MSVFVSREVTQVVHGQGVAVPSLVVFFNFLNKIIFLLVTSFCWNCCVALRFNTSFDSKRASPPMRDQRTTVLYESSRSRSVGLTSFPGPGSMLNPNSGHLPYICIRHSTIAKLQLYVSQHARHHYVHPTFSALILDIYAWVKTNWKQIEN